MLKTNEYILSRIRSDHIECINLQGEPVNLPLSSLKDFHASDKPTTPDFTSFLDRPREFLNQLREKRNTISFEKPKAPRKSKAPSAPKLAKSKAISPKTQAIQANLSKLDPVSRRMMEDLMKSKPKSNPK